MTPGEGSRTRARSAVATARADLLVGLETEVGVLIRRVKRVIAERAEVVHPDLAPASYLLLTFLAEQGPVRASALVGRFHVDKGAISRQVQHLEELGLVERHPDPDDGRASLLGANADARRRLEAVTVERRRFLDARLGDWDDADLEAFVAALGRYNRALEKPST